MSVDPPASSTVEPAATIRYRARWVWPVAGQPIENAVLSVLGGNLTEVRRADRNPASRGEIDLGDVVLLPGLVNAHTHLEFSDLPRPVGEPGMELANWLELTIGLRTQQSDSSRTSTIERGYREIAATGTVLVGEIATPPWPGVSLVSADQLRPKVIALAEVVGLSRDRADERLAAAMSHWQEASPGAGISPHAPYSVPPELLDRCIEFATQRRCLVAMHVAESPAERRLLTTGDGPLADSLRRMGRWQPGIFPWTSPAPMTRLIEQLARTPRALLVHGNDLREGEIEALAKHRHLSVVVCPRTHAFFQHARHPVDRLLAAGVRVALGTDSRASNPDLDVWGEVQFLLRHRQDLPPSSIIEMATLQGQLAMTGQPNGGTLTAGQPARFHSVPTTATTLDQLIADLAVQTPTRATQLVSNGGS